MPPSNRIHYFHGDACALSGYLESPVVTNIAPQASLSLAPSGGYGSTDVGPFQVEGAISFESASAQVSGSLSPNKGQGWVTLVTSVVEGLNILGVVTADSVTAQISTEHPLVGDNPTVTFLGTQFVNLRIAGNPVDVDFNLDICNQGAGYPAVPCMQDNNFLARVSQQYAGILNPNNLPNWVVNKTIPAWLKQRYQSTNVSKNRNSVLCSLVSQVIGEFPGIPYGNVLEIPNFGIVSLGQLIVDHNSYRLIMVNAEMDSISTGSISLATCTANGTTEPP
jgi:hypothetical protein